MTFNPNIPQPTDTLSVSQGELLTNDTQLNTVFNVDHVAFDDATVANRGKHTSSTLRDFGGDPTPAAGEGTIYSNTVGARIESFYRYPSSGPITQLTWIKAWCTFNGDGAIGATAIIDSYNVASINKLNNTNFSITYTTALGNANYAVFGSATTTTVRIGAGSLTVNAVTVVANGVSPGYMSVLIIGT